MQEAESMTIDEYEENVRYLIGKQVAKVLYHEVDYSDGKYYFFDDPRFDSLDFGLEFEFTDGKFSSITWGNEFYPYGVSLIHNTFSQVASQPRVLDVSERNRWTALIGTEICSVDVFWSWCEEYGKPRTRVSYPQDILLQFEQGQNIVISALEIRQGDDVLGMMDNITVFDDIEVARKFNCLQRHNK